MTDNSCSIITPKHLTVELCMRTKGTFRRHRGPRFKREEEIAKVESSGADTFYHVASKKFNRTLEFIWKYLKP